MKAMYILLITITMVINEYLVVYSSLNSSGLSREFRVVSICTDAEDLLFTHRLVEFFNTRGYRVFLKILFLNKYSTDAPAHFNMLRNIWFMREFDQIWIFDYSIEFSIGSLTQYELSIIERVVSEGRLLIMGYETFLNNRNELLDEIFGVNYIGTGREIVDKIEFLNKTYLYNSTQSGYLLLRSTKSFIAGFFIPIEYPAVFINKHGNGVATLLAFNPVEQSVKYGNKEMYKITGEVINYSTRYLGVRRDPPFPERLYYILFLSINIYNVSLIIFAVFSTLLVTCYLGIPPYGFMKIFVKLLVIAKLIGRSNYSEIIDNISQNPDVTIYELAIRLKKRIGRVKYILAVLESKGVVESSRDNTGRLVFKTRLS